MKKLINRPQAVVDDTLDGRIAVDPSLARRLGHTVVVRSDLRPQGIELSFASPLDPKVAGDVER